MSSVRIAASRNAGTAPTQSAAVSARGDAGAEKGLFAAVLTGRAGAAPPSREDNGRVSPGPGGASAATPSPAAAGLPADASTAPPPTGAAALPGADDTGSEAAAAAAAPNVAARPQIAGSIADLAGCLGAPIEAAESWSPSDSTAAGDDSHPSPHDLSTGGLALPGDAAIAVTAWAPATAAPASASPATDDGSALAPDPTDAVPAAFARAVPATIPQFAGAGIAQPGAKPAGKTSIAIPSAVDAATSIGPGSAAQSAISEADGPAAAAMSGVAPATDAKTSAPAPPSQPGRDQPALPVGTAAELAPIFGSDGGIAGSGASSQRSRPLVGEALDPGAGAGAGAVAAAAAAPASPAAASAAPGIATPASLAPAEPGFAQGFSEHVVRLASTAGGEIVVQLRPPALGELTVRVAVAGHDVSAWFGAAQLPVQQAISDALGQLQSSLGNAGYTLTGAWVGGDASAGRDAGGYGGAAARRPPRGIAAAAISPPGVAPTGQASSRINVYV